MQSQNKEKTKTEKIRKAIQKIGKSLGDEKLRRHNYNNRKNTIEKISRN